jgi:hypothetical protein
MSMVLVSGNEACTEAIATTQANIPKSCSEDSEGPQQERKGNKLRVNYKKLPHLRRSRRVSTTFANFFKSVPFFGQPTTDSTNSLQKAF